LYFKIQYTQLNTHTSIATLDRFQRSIRWPEDSLGKWLVMSLDIAIVGAGIAGLTTAAMLLKNGHRVSIYEQASELSEIGAGIQISANAGQVLHHLGLADQLNVTASMPDTWYIRAHNTGSVLNTIELGSSYAKQHGVPHYLICRSELHQLLLSVVRAYKDHEIRLNTKVTRFTETDNNITIYSECGFTTTADLVIGADGIHSAIREQIVADDKPEYVGCAVWRATIDSSRLPDNLYENSLNTWVGQSRHVVTYWLKGGQSLNFVGAVKCARENDEHWITKHSWHEMQSDFKGWHQNIQAIIAACDRDSCERWALGWRQPVENWCSDKGRGILIGDAAHPTPPFLAQGACMAIEDAAVLARALSYNPTIKHAFQLFQHNRIPRTTDIVNASYNMAQLNHIFTEAELHKAHTSADTYKARHKWIYSYNPLTTALA
jgi:2-polyprenyl-6-methoxyphenol hydroxylase-like FAD-dependent oxidoreductase